MNSRTLRGGALAAAVLASALIATPAQAAPVVAEDGAAACEVSGGTLNWGLKETFRSYISGTIANGEWETSEGAEYETPEFIWTSASGAIDPDTGTGEVSFEGTVHFTGHDGALDLTISNPTVEFEDDGGAALMLDTRSTDVEGEVTVDEEQVWFGDITVDQPLAPADGSLLLEGLPVTLTNSGAGAFAGFYDAGEDLDPLTISLEFDACEGAAAAPVEEEPVEEIVAISEPEQSIPWIPIIIGAIALLVIGVTTGMLIGGRKRKPAAQQQAQQPGSHADSDSADKLFGE